MTNKVITAKDTNLINLIIYKINEFEFENDIEKDLLIDTILKSLYDTDDTDQQYNTLQITHY